jgi:Circularly permutated YpsA SLOG family
MMYRGLSKVISGGQTGADQGGLLAAHKLGVLTGGTAPGGWATSFGPNMLLQAFGLQASGTLQTRTAMNVRNSTGTVIFAERPSSPGSMMTRRVCVELGKPYHDIDLAPFVASAIDGSLGTREGPSIALVSSALHVWLIEHQITTLNVAGNRERTDGNFFITEFTEYIVDCALRLLDLDQLLIRDSDL